MNDKQKKIITIAMIALVAVSLVVLSFSMKTATWENGIPVGVALSCLACGIGLTAISFLALDKYKFIRIVVRVYGIVDIVAAALSLVL